MTTDFTGQVLAALDKLDGKIDSIRESLSEHRSGITALETWRASVQSENQRAREDASDLEARMRKQEEWTAGQRVRVAIAAVIASAAVSGVIGLVLQFKK